MSADAAFSDSDVLRIQALALAAQQSALTEQEIRIREQARELEQRERQLALHLDEQQQQLIALQDQLGSARDQLRRERADVETVRAEAAAARSDAVADRERLRTVRTRFVQRWKKQWTGERRKVDTLLGEIADESHRIRSEREAFEEFRKRFHGDAELEKRRLQDERQNLNRERAQLQTERREFAADLNRWETQLNDRQNAVRSGEQKLADERMAAERWCAALQGEATGLENRIVNLRKIVLKLERQRAAADMAALPPLPNVELPPPFALNPDDSFAAHADYYQKQQAMLKRQAAALADQRLHLAELCERLAVAESGWHQKRVESVGELEELSGELQQGDDSIRGWTREVQTDADRVRQEREAVGRLRRELERGASELAARQATWVGERNRHLAEIHGQQRAVERRERAMSALFRRWRDRRAEELAQFRQTLQAMSEERTAWIAQREEWRHRSDSLRQAMQAIAEQALALEEARQEFLHTTEHPRAAARRLERLRRRRDGLSDRAKRDLDKRRSELDTAESAFESALQDHQKWFDQFVERERELTANMSEAELQRFRFEAESERLESERTVWREQRHHYERQLAQMRDEVERMAGILIEDGPERVSSAA